jgi:hypothetical protein
MSLPTEECLFYVLLNTLSTIHLCNYFIVRSGGVEIATNWMKVLRENTGI